MTHYRADFLREMKTHFAFLLLILTGAAMASQKQGQRYCGRRLAAVLAYVCDSNFNKRSQERIIGTQIQDHLFKEDTVGTQIQDHIFKPRITGPQSQGNMFSFNWPWIGSYRPLSFDRLRSKRQVVSECCEKPCTVDDLLSYCGN